MDVPGEEHGSGGIADVRGLCCDFWLAPCINFGGKDEGFISLFYLNALGCESVANSNQPRVAASRMRVISRQCLSTIASLDDDRHRSSRSDF